MARDANILGMAGEGQCKSASARAALETTERLEQALILGVLLPELIELLARAASSIARPDAYSSLHCYGAILIINACVFSEKTSCASASVLTVLRFNPTANRYIQIFSDSFLEGLLGNSETRELIAGCSWVDLVGLLFGMAYLTGTLSSAWVL